MSQCQFEYEPGAQCVYRGCSDGEDYCGIHQEVVNARIRAKRNRARTSPVRVEEPETLLST